MTAPALRISPPVPQSLISPSDEARGVGFSNRVARTRGHGILMQPLTESRIPPAANQRRFERVERGGESAF